MKKRTALIEALEQRIAPAVLFAVETSTNKLVSFDSAAPGTLLTDITITGLQAGETVAGIDFRPATGELYALGIVDVGATQAGRIYKLNTTTAAATQVGSAPFSSTLGDVQRWGFDFNPDTDTIRVVGLLDDNLRVNPTNGTIAGTDTVLSDGAGTDEQITAVAYDRTFSAGGTTLYGFNRQNNGLVTIGGINGSPSPDGGQLITVAPVTLGGVALVTTNSLIGFDIGGNIGGAERGWLGANTTGNTTAHLFSVNLTTAALTDHGAIGTGARIFGGLAVKQFGEQPVISADGKTAKWTDVDGDAVTMKITKGDLTQAGFKMLAGAKGDMLAKFSVPGLTFTGTNITITAKPGAAGGDGAVNVGEIASDLINLGAVTIGGDLIKINAGSFGGSVQGVKSLTVRSFAAYGTGPVDAFFSGSEIRNGIGKLAVAGNMEAFLQVQNGTVGSITIGGDLDGREFRGSLNASNSTVGKVTIKGSIIGGDGSSSGYLSVSRCASIVIGGSVTGGGGSDSGVVSIGFSTTPTLVSIGGGVIGGGGNDSGVLKASRALNAVVKGDILGGSGAGSGEVGSSGGALSLTVGGSIRSGSAAMGALEISAPQIKSLTVKGSVTGSDIAPVNITATGNTAGILIGKATIGGSLAWSSITASGTADAAIGAVKIGGDMVASSIAAGVDAKNGIFGDADDEFKGGTTGSDAIIAKIASVTIGGQLLGTVGGAADSFGILAEHIGTLVVNKIKVPLTAGKDDRTLGFTGDVRVREL